VIYEPKGRAREYAPLALNLYTQCGHGCLYCYAPKALRRQNNEAYFVKNALPSSRFNLKTLEAKVKEYANTQDKYLHLSFVGDPYDRTRKDNSPVTKVLELCLKHRVPVQILTKGGTRCLIDLDLFKAFGKSIRVGQSLTFGDDKLSRFFEPFTALPENRLDALQILKEQGVSTWASFEPVVDLNQSLELLVDCLQYDLCDYYKIGAISGTNQPEVDWEVFLELASRFINLHKAKAYFKNDLRARALVSSRRLTKEQTDMNAYPVEAFDKDDNWVKQILGTERVGNALTKKGK
jgi:DNA repair photolyase